MDRLQHRSEHEKKRHSGGAGSVNTDIEGNRVDPEDSDDGSETSSDHGPPRKVFVNLSLPPDMLDENGRPATQFNRNKIRTAKYTPLSFIPKNIYFQFKNIANLYFLFLIILGVRFI
jgi:phospholipid-translocating ATPase